MSVIPQKYPANLLNSRQQLIASYQRIRNMSAAICAPLNLDDYQIQSIVETSPPKWHLAHVTWFFETFLLKDFLPDYQPCNPDYSYLFNSYYQTVGTMHARAKRDLLSRPTVEQVYQYRADIDKRIVDLFTEIDESQWQKIAFRIALGLHHEQQHKELLYMDIKHNLWSNPMRPAYLEQPQWIIEMTDEKPDFSIGYSNP